VEGLLLVLRLFGTNSLMTSSSLSRKLLEFSTLNTSGGADILNEDILRTNYQEHIQRKKSLGHY